MKSVIIGVIKLCLSAAFLMFGLMKLTPALKPEVHQFLTIQFNERYLSLWQRNLFNNIGFVMPSGDIFRIIVGASEVAGALGLWIRPLAALAGLGLAGIMAAASVTHMWLNEPWQFPAALGVASFIVALASFGSKKQEKNSKKA